MSVPRPGAFEIGNENDPSCALLPDLGGRAEKTVRGNCRIAMRMQEFLKALNGVSECGTKG